MEGAQSESIRNQLRPQFQKQQQAIIATLADKNSQFFELEMEKLERWAGDLKDSLEHELKDLDREIKETKREAQLTMSLEQKLGLHKRIKELEKRRAEKIPFKKEPDLVAVLETVKTEAPGFTDFERDFPSLCFALATGVGKTRLMGAFIS